MFLEFLVRMKPPLLLLQPSLALTWRTNALSQKYFCPRLLNHSQYFAQNPLGTCGECGGQLFVNDDCTKAFFCMLPDDLPDGAPEDAEGCELVCEDDEVLIADPRYSI